MVITSKTRMSQFKKLSYLLELSEVDLIKEISKYEVPKEINGLAVCDKYSVSLRSMLDFWDCKDNDELQEIVKKTYLLDTEEKKKYYAKKIKKDENLYLIDFIRLLIYAQQVSVDAGKKFSSLKIENKDTRIDSIMKKYKGDAMDMVARFCKMFPSYTIKTALDISWWDIFKAFESETKQANIQIEISELKPL